MLGPGGAKPGGLASLYMPKFFHYNAQQGGRPPEPQSLARQFTPRPPQMMARGLGGLRRF
jgi:hypothetical protein